MSGRTLANVRKDISYAGRDGIAQALDKCEAASRKRNRLVHGAWATSGAESITIRSKRGSHLVGLEHWTVEQIEEIAKDLFYAYRGLGKPIVHELGAASMSLGWKLRQSDQTNLPADLTLNY